MEPLFDVPNVELLADDELATAEIVFARLAAIAGHTRTARRMRLTGDIEAALASERCADDQYQQLPAWARW